MQQRVDFAEKRMAQAERAAADKVASTTVEAQKAQEAATASVARAKAVIERCDELRAESERDRNAAKRASTRASECLALAEARAVELVQAHQGARRLEEERAAEIARQRALRGATGRREETACTACSSSHAASAYITQAAASSAAASPKGAPPPFGLGMEDTRLRKSSDESVELDV